MTMSEAFSHAANRVSHAAGRPLAFLLCVALVVIWALSGPLFGFSDTWQLVINTSTTVVTFLMVFLIQNTQNRDNAAIQTKLDALISDSDSDDSYIGIEHLSDEELEAMREACEQRAHVVIGELKARQAGKKKSPRPRAKTRRSRASSPKAA